MAKKSKELSTPLLSDYDIEAVQKKLSSPVPNKKAVGEHSRKNRKPKSDKQDAGGLTNGIEENDKNDDKQEKKKARLSFKSLALMLKPYFWPDKTSSSAMLNRTLAVLTWVCVVGSKLSSLSSPIILGRASTALSHQLYHDTAKYIVVYVAINFVGVLCKEGQRMLYLKVSQAAFVQLSEIVFKHLHSLSLDWHLNKKLGEVLRSMDRGIQACDTLMQYLFLWLIPAFIEAIAVCVIFALYFDYLPLGITMFVFVFVYIVYTIGITTWRKKFRKNITKTDNDWHDKCTDSLVNFETVKYFTAEDFEKKRFGEAVMKYQISNVQVKASMSFLNITQSFLMQSALGTCLILATFGIKKNIVCCVNNGCEEGDAECCASLNGSCGGMELGDFVAVLAFVLNLFQPLNYLGSVYNAVVMAVIDLRSLSELLAENPDVIDALDAFKLPSRNMSNPDIGVEFDNVVFHYPSQPDTKGLKGISFKMRRGTTTAIVGTTGAGKTTVSRLFFRLYDVTKGAVEVNGSDVRMVTQKSLRGSIGVVPQATTMFNDTIRANIMYGRHDASEEEVEKVVEAAQLSGFIKSLPEGLETMVGDRGLKLSGGEKQRVAIARCLLKDPPFVILDEATSSLDTITENSVQEALDVLGSDRTCLVIAHRLGTIKNADNIIVLDNGLVLEEGTHEILLQLNGKYADMWNMQLHNSAGFSSRSNFLNFEEQNEI